ncbi:MAG: restriction endonuclease subunit S [Parvibaculaceae bacterium]
MINDDAWTWRPLGELFEIGAGKTMSAAARDGAVKTPFLRTSNVLWDEIDLTTVDEMAIPEQELATKLLRPGDLLVCEGGEIGRAAIWNGERAVMSFQNHLHRLRSLNAEVEPHFYVYFLQAAFTQLGIFEGAGNKTTIPNLSRNRLAALEVPHPPLPEQRAISTTLARVHEAIRTHDRSTETAQELKSAAMRTLFTCGLRGEPQKETVIGPVPRSWTTRPLEDTADIYSSSRLSYSELLAREGDHGSDGSVPVLGIKVIDLARCEAEVPLSDAELARRVSKAEAEHRCIRPGAIVFPKNGAAVATNKKRRVANWCVLDPNVMALHAKDGVEQAYLYQWVQSFDLKSIVKPGPVPNFGKGDISGVLVPVPATQDEQHEIVAILDAVDRKIDLHKRKRAVLDELFESLLHQLMTGDIAVSDLDLSALALRKVAEAAA